MKIVNINDIKTKFGNLLSFASLQCQIKEDILNSKIVNNPYFDFLENNNPSSFLTSTIEEICLTVFGADIRNNTSNFRNDMRYIGECYISISISLSIPLRKLFLLYPIDKMLLLYPSYHEMGTFRIIEKVNNDLNNITAFSILLSNSNLSINSISKMCNCNRRTLYLLKENREYEDQINYKTLLSLCEILATEPVFFSKSNFVPYSLYLWEDEIFLEIFKSKVYLIVSDNYPIIFPNLDDDNQLPHIRVTYKAIEYVNTRNDRQIPGYLYDYLLKISIEEYKLFCYQSGKAFC